MDHHNYSFFGQKSALIMDSAKPSEPFIFLRFLKKLPEGRWEKPSLGEGKNLKINLLEITEMLRVLNTINSEWSTVHRFQETQTSIKMTNQGQKVQFFVTGYAKPLMPAEVRILTDLLEHIYHEKIEQATGRDPKYAPENQSSTVTPTPSPIPSPPTVQQPNTSTPATTILTVPVQPPISPENWVSHLRKDDGYVCVPGEITARREKAVSYNVSGRNTIWIPISQVKDEFQQIDADIWVKEWFINTKLNDIFPAPQEA
ncbi:MAG: hypothetical protein ACTSYI_11835 [Promethearchaeota archaeon]